MAIACLPIFFTGHCIQRWEGAVFVGYAVAYTAHLVPQATEHRALAPFSLVMLLFVLPLDDPHLAPTPSLRGPLAPSEPPAGPLGAS